MIFVPVISFVLLYSQQTIFNIRKVLTDNRAKRNAVIFKLLEDAKRKLDHIAASVREEVLVEPQWTDKVKEDRFDYYIEGADAAYVLMLDAKNVLAATRRLLGAIKKVRFYLVYLLILFLLASGSLSSTTGYDLQVLVGFWTIVLLIFVPLCAYYIYDGYNSYKEVKNTLDEKKVGLDDDVS